MSVRSGIFAVVVIAVKLNIIDAFRNNDTEKLFSRLQRLRLEYRRLVHLRIPRRRPHQQIHHILLVDKKKLNRGKNWCKAAHFFHEDVSFREFSKARQRVLRNAHDGLVGLRRDELTRYPWAIPVFQHAFRDSEARACLSRRHQNPHYRESSHWEE